MDLGLEQPGFWVKGGLGSFGGRRVFLAFAPDDRHFSDTFAAFETDSTDGPGGVRGGERSSFVGQLGGGEHDVQWKATVAIGTARFDFPGLLPQRFVEQGGDPWAARQPLGRDRTSQALVGADVLWTVGEGTLGIGAFAGKTKTTFHQNLTGFVLDDLAGLPPAAPDDSEQINDASTLGLTALYRHGVEITSKRDSIELGLVSRVDSVDQSDTRLLDDGTKNGTLVDATVDATNIAAYADLSLYPIKRVVIRGGPRLDSLSYGVEDHASNKGLESTAQGFHLGNKAMIDVALGGGTHLVASYGEGFRSPQARELAEGDKVPFATVRSVEGGARWKQEKYFQASAVGFGSWLDHDRVFDATARENVEAPPSVRAGVATAVATHVGPFGTSVSGTDTHTEFTSSDSRFRDGDPVPYAPTFVLRTDSSLSGRIGRVGGRKVTGKLGAGIEGVAGRSLPLPGGPRTGQDLICLDALAALGWRGVELAVNGTNLLDQRYYDSQYVYVSNFEKSPTLPPASEHVLVAEPASIFVTLQIHILGTKSESDQRDQDMCIQHAKTPDEAAECRE